MVAEAEEDLVKAPGECPHSLLEEFFRRAEVAGQQEAVKVEAVLRRVGQAGQALVHPVMVLAVVHVKVRDQEQP